MNRTGNKATLQWISNVAGRKKIFIIFLVLIHMLQALCSIGMAVILKRVVDEAVAGNRHGFEYAIFTFIVVIFVRIVLATIARYLDEYTYASFENEFKGRLFSKLLIKEYATVTATHSGEWMNRLTSDTVVVSDGLTHIAPGAVGMIVKLVGALSLMIMYIPAIAYIIVPGGIALLGLTYAMRSIMKRMHKSVQEADGRMRVFMQENLGSMMVVRAFAREHNTIVGAAKKMEDHKNARMKRNNISNLCNTGFAVMMNGVYIFGVGYCCYGILKGEMSYGMLMAVMQLVGQLQAPLANITGYLPRYYTMLASAERLMEVEAYPEEEADIKSLDEIKSFYNVFHSLGLKNATFSYTNDENEIALDNINIEINKGEFIALTGASGCGKSTLLKLIMCIYPLKKGERYLSVHTENEDEKHVLDNSYKRLFAYVPQGNHLMSGTIRQVVSFYDENVMKDDERIMHALKIACADGFISELIEGIDTKLGERGLGLSEGQMQRIAIARAVLADCPILLLDEATSALDDKTEKQVLENIQKMTEKTVIIVTHRPAALDICDRKIEMS